MGPQPAAIENTKDIRTTHPLEMQWMATVTTGGERDAYPQVKAPKSRACRIKRLTGL